MKKNELEFSSETIKELKYYVYVYSDPDTGKPFYVGKGKGNRVFAHLTDDGESEKSSRIKSITDSGKKPVIQILVHGIDEETALKVEAAAIDLIGIENLTNRQRGHQSSTFGKIEAKALEARYSCEQLKEEDITHNVIIIKVNQLYQNTMSPHELYEITRRYWRVNLEKAKKADYVFSVYDGLVVEVYKVAQWFEAFTTMGTVESDDETEKEKIENRYEFVGNIAPEEVRAKYKYKSVSGLFTKGEQNPIKYLLSE